MSNRVSESIFKNWRSYAGAAGATLAMSTAAHASTIVFSGPIDVKANLGARSYAQASFSINGYLLQANVVARFYNLASSHYISAQAFFRGSLYFPSVSWFYTARNYAAGQTIFFGAGSADARLAVNGGQQSIPTSTLGQFAVRGTGNVTGYLGFRDPANHFGWIQVEVSTVASQPREIQVLGYAYDTTANEAILAGDTGVTAPEPGTIGLAVLGLGAAGIAAWRRRRAEVAA